MDIKANLLIQGDALQLLECMTDQTVDLVYIDPPWQAMEDSISGSKDNFRNFFYKVLQQSQRVLKLSGNIFLYSRPELNLDFSSLLREVFGDNFVSEIVIPINRTTSNVQRSTHETLFFYRMSEAHVNNKIYRNSQEEIIKLFPKEDSRGRYTYYSLFGPMTRSSLIFEWHGITPPDGYSWRYNKESLDRLHADGLLEQRQDRIYLKKYFTSDEQLWPIGSLWDDIGRPNWNNRDKGTQSVKLLERIIKIGTLADQVVLDPFCGSGPAIEASLNLGRKFIACDNNENAVAACKQRLDKEQPDAVYDMIGEDELVKLPVIWSLYAYKREEDEIADIIVKGENAFLEFKESACWNYVTSKKENELSEKVVRAVASFLNADGGSLFIGVRNDGMLRDLVMDFEAANPQKKNKDGYELFLCNKIRDLLGIEAVHKSRIAFFNIKNCQICRIEVGRSEEPVFLNKEFFVRANNRTEKLSMPEFYTYMQRRASGNRE